ncbi:uncharacterized protein B0I36DRAFT_367474 [Microdochium trichocladiopsis]|uniref:Integral membrane bound transporter domain-containing protein n=1 Tax=Microdochium trichocladiopsis TaxID=1682393 RepID=A0A9P8XXW0_9PEZI|nr:uncharacterized protein B0I36DRAFT_367474 [Microdochium trichocladiopsis]KAH7021015.1 hypothetical protein B0I36DRAFT_367474 [Microdochium trichocladiopsis]
MDRPPTAREGLSNLVKRKTSAGTQRRRTPSVSSLDRVFATHSEPLAPSEPEARRQAPLIGSEPTNEDDTYGLIEMRDSFFDAIFSVPNSVEPAEILKQAQATLPFAFRKRDPLSLSGFLPKQWREIRGVVRRVTTTRAGIKLLKSFAAFYFAYILCLVPSVRGVLGNHYYITAVSTILGHPGRVVGAQVDGAVQTIIGTATGLGWGALGLWISTSTTKARDGYGGVLATFLFLYIFVIGFIRTYYIRTYQGIICAGIAIAYTCLADVSANEVSWAKLLDFAIPWALGQAIALCVCVVVSPDAGARPLAVALHQAFEVMLDGLVVAGSDHRRMRRRLASTFVNLSQAYRDLILDISITYFDPKDVFDLRNLIQNVLRSQLSLQNETRLYEGLGRSAEIGGRPILDEFVVSVNLEPASVEQNEELELMKFVASYLANPTETLLGAMREALKSCDAVLMDMSGLRQYLGPAHDVSNDVAGALVTLRKGIIEFSRCQDTVLASERLPASYGQLPELVKLFAFCRPVHQTASAIEALLVKVNNMQQRKPRYPRFHWPSYPAARSLFRNNAQVRHDRGGVTAGAYFRSFNEIAELIQKIKSRNFQPLPRTNYASKGSRDEAHATMTADELEDDSPTKRTKIRYGVWKALHRLQGFETRFGLKTAAVTTLLSVPAWLTKDSDWWNTYEAWWAVVMAWLIMGSRTGGNIQDLMMRSFCAVLGAVWAGLAFAAGNGSPYVMAVFCLIYMPPMLYRYTQSSHPRSGLVGCLAFTTISLTLNTAPEDTSHISIAAIRGAAMVVGVVASILVNWILWPFVARHDLRKGISLMLFYSSIVYRSIVSKYVYYEAGREPTQEDIDASEQLEGRLREGFVRLRQLLGLTRHEIRLRSPFDPLPYSGLIDASERFFEHVVALRQASLFYHPKFIRDNAEAAAELLPYRRDAIAAILTNLYVLSGALRANRKMPKYLPSAAAARAQLLQKSSELQDRIDADEEVEKEEKAESRKWSQIYSYSYNESLTGCVEQLEELEKYTKAIVGEQGFDCGFLDTSLS